MPSSTISGQTSGIEHFSVRPEGREPPLRLTFGDVFIILASGLVAMAIAIGLVVQIGLDVPLASSLAGMAMVATLIGHAALRISDHRRAPVSRSRQDPSHENDQYRPSVAALPRDGVAAAEDGAATSPDADGSNVPRRSSVDINAEAEGTREAPADMRGTVAIGGMDGDRSVPLPGAGHDSLDLGKVRPRAPGALNVHDEAVSIGDGATVGPGNIDAMIKRLASDIETGRKSRAIAPAKDGRSGSATAPPPLPVPAAAAEGQPPLASEAAPTAQQKKSRPPAFPPKLDAMDRSPPATASSPTATAKLAAIADALSDEQLDVYLETINGLEDYRAQHYEVSVRLRLDGGAVLDNAAFTEETRGTGLLPLIEAVKVSSTKRLAVQMLRRGRSGDFFAAIDGEALSEMQFSTDVGTITSGDPMLASRLVLAFTQADVRGLTKAQRATLEEIASLGFRFSVESITDLDMDFHDLARRGFAFAKLDAPVFLGGLPLGSGHVPPTDLCRHLADAGLDLIVGSIGTEDARARILDCGASLGQGALFGAPRPVRASVLKPATEGQMAAQQRP